MQELTEKRYRNQYTVHLHSKGFYRSIIVSDVVLYLSWTQKSFCIFELGDLDPLDLISVVCDLKVIAPY